MINYVYAVYDSKAAIYGTPFFMPKDAMAIRAFTDIANDRKTMVGSHPEDFSLFQVGEFNDVTGEIVPVNHSNLGMAASFVRPLVPLDLGDLVRGNGKSIEVRSER